MARLDDPGVDRPHWDLMQALTLRRQEGVRRRCGGRRCTPKGTADRPAPVIEPWTRIERAIGGEAGQIEQRALESDRRRVARANRGEAARGTGQLQQRDGWSTRVRGHARHARRTPEREQRPLAARERLDGVAPSRFVDRFARPNHPSSFATCWNQTVMSGGKKTPAATTRARWPNIGRYDALTGAAPGLGSPKARP